MDKGEGENLENLSTCFGIPATEPLFSSNWANLIFAPLLRSCQYVPEKLLSLSGTPQLDACWLAVSQETVRKCIYTVKRAESELPIFVFLAPLWAAVCPLSSFQSKSACAS